MKLASLAMIINQNNGHVSSKEMLLNVKQGIFQCIAPISGIYQIELESRSTATAVFAPAIAKGVNIKIELKFKKNEKIFFFLCDTVYLFDSKFELLAVPGAAGLFGGNESSGSVDIENPHTDHFNTRLSRYSDEYCGYGNTLYDSYCMSH